MSQQKAKVLYNYSAQNADELNLKVGDVVTIHEIFDDHWIQGELNGIVGMFPENYVQLLDAGVAGNSAVVVASPGTGGGKDTKLPDNHVVALVDNESNQSGQLAFKRGDVIKVIERFPTGWLRGECNGKVGVLKKEFVSEDPSAVGSGGGNATQGGSSGGTKGKVIYAFQANYPSQISLEVGQEVTIYEEVQQGWMKGECNGKVGIFPGSFVQKFESASITDSQSHSQPQSLSSPTQSQLSSSQQQGSEAVAIHPYKANGAGQLSFETGDIIIVTAKLQAGWWSGKHAATGESGIFPGSFVKDKSATETANSPAQSNTSFKVRVLHDYQPAGPNQLALKIGQIITVTRELPRGWWFGEIDGASGAFPASFTKKLDDVSSAPPSTNTSNVTKTLVIANYDFQGGEGKLSFSKGEKLYLIKELDKGWSNGEKDGKIGLFPTSYVSAAPIEQTDNIHTQSSNHDDQIEVKPSHPPPAAISSNRGRPNPQQELPKPQSVPPQSVPPQPMPKPETQSVPPQLLPKPEVQSVTPQLPPKQEVQSVTPQPLPKPEVQPVTPQPPSKPEGQGGSGLVPPPPPSGVPVPPKPNQEPPKKIPSAKPEPVAAKVEKPAPAIVFDNNELEKKIAERARKIADQDNTNKPVPENPVNEKPIQPTEIKKQEKVVPAKVEETVTPTPTSLNPTSSLPNRNSGTRTSAGTSPRTNAVTVTQKPPPAQVSAIHTTTPVDQDELGKYKTALTKLQAQTKVAIDQMMEIIGKQNKDYLKLVSVIREMKLEIIEEQKKSQQLGEQNRKLYTDLTTLQKYYNESRGSALPSKQGVSSIQEELEIERQRRHDLESHVNKLQTELDNLQRRLGRLENQGFI